MLGGEVISWEWPWSVGPLPSEAREKADILGPVTVDPLRTIAIHPTNFCSRS